MKCIKVIESFITWQGEGNDSGKRMLLLRMKKCNRSCKWCDTSVKMRISVETLLPFLDIQDIVKEEKCGILITGGEPTYNLNLTPTVDLINATECSIFNVETNGFDLLGLISRVRKGKNVNYSLSPKIFDVEDLEFYKNLVKDERIINNPRVFIKLVYENRELITEFLKFLQSINFDNQRVFLMPEGTTREIILEHAPYVFDAAEKYKFNFSSREHVMFGFI